MAAIVAAGLDSDAGGGVYIAIRYIDKRYII
jgi:hypothetical protein